jgi:hypothetical protein
MFTATILALSLLSGDPRTTSANSARTQPAKTCVAIDRTGTFRVMTKKDGGTALGLGLVLLENIDGCLEATFVTDESGPALIDNVSITGDTLKGNLHLSTGTAKLSLQFIGTNVVGTIVQGRNAWSVEGRKTS